MKGVKFTLVLINADGSYENDITRARISEVVGKSQYKIDKLIKEVTKDGKDASFTFNFENGAKMMVIAYGKEDETADNAAA